MGVAVLVGAPAAAYILLAAPPQAKTLHFSNEGTDLAASDVESALKELSQRVKRVEGGHSALESALLVEQGQIGTVRSAVEEHQAATESRIEALEGKVAASVRTRKRLEYSDGASSNTVGAAYAPLRDIGSFSKSAATTGVLLTWNTHIDAMGEPGTFCDFQLRVDGKPDEDVDGGGGRAVVYVPPNATGGSSPVAVAALFSRVGTGHHTVGVWLRGTSRECLENYGNFPRAVIVEEGP
jgi:hypothetical protein